MKDKTNLKNRLEVGDKVFYYDGYTSWDIEEVEKVNKSDKTAVLSNNATISRYPNPNGTFTKVNATNSYVVNRSELMIMRLTPELEKMRTAIMCKKQLSNYLFHINQNILGRADIKNWKNWTPVIQDTLINLVAKISSVLNEEGEPTEEEMRVVKKITNKSKKNKS